MRKVLVNMTVAVAMIAVCLCFGTFVSAQETSASLVGTVRDASGAVVPGATITITDSEKGAIVRTITANDNGEFSAPNLGVGVFQITVEAPNFKKAVRTAVKLDLGQNRNVDVTLEAGNISEVVTVEADPVAVDLQSATSGTLINGDQVREMPINNRNFTQLVTLAPGVSNDLSDQVYQGTVNPDGQANTVQISVNGARSSQNTFTVDGADITDRGSNLTIQAYPSVDSIGEFRVLRSLYPAESGRSGGGQVNVVTKAGTRKFSGSVFEFIRNEAFNANDYFTNQRATNGIDEDGKARRRPFRYNNYGWTLGGPVYFFNFGEKNPDEPMITRLPKTFFFFSQEFRQDKRYPTLTSSVPTGALKQGIFTAPICLQATGGTGTCTTVLPAGTPLSTLRTISPTAQKYINLIYNKLPEPSNPTTFQLFAPVLSIAKFHQELIKIDHSFTKDWFMYYRYQRDTIPTTDANSLFSSGSGLPGVSTTATDSPGRTHTAQSTYVITPNLIAEARFTFGYGAILSNTIGTLNNQVSPISTPMPFTSYSDRVPTISGNGFSALQGFGPYDNFSYKGNLSGSLTWIKGNHTMKFGAVYSKYRKNENAITGNNEGIYSGFLTPGGTANVIPTGGNTTQQLWANFLLGTNVTFTQASDDYTADLRQKAFEGFAQDEFRVRNNLTLYMGVRYSFFGSPWDKNGRLNNFDPSLWKASDAPAVTGAGNRVAGTGNFCNGLIYNSQNPPPAYANCTPTASPYGKFVVDVSKKDFAPRFGIAFDPFGDGKTAIRTGYGIFHEQVLNGIYLWLVGLNSTYLQNYSLTRVSLDQPVPTGTNVNAVSGAAPASLRGIQPNFNTPYMQHWSFDVQRQLTAKTVMTVGYYGSKGTHLLGAYEENTLQPGAAIAKGATGCATGATYLGQTGATLGPCQVAGSAFTSSTQSFILDQIRPYRGYRSLNMYETRYNSNYHSLQVSGQHRFATGSQVNLAYTWSKNLTDNQTDRSTGPQNSYDISQDYGRASLDRRHIVSVNYIYELPIFRKQEGFLGKALGGWQLSGIASYNTGLPFTVTRASFDPAGLGTIPAILVGTRPDLLCNPNEGGAQTETQWFNTSCFSFNPTVTSTGVSNTVGTSGRGVVTGPPTTRFDANLSKTFKFNVTDKQVIRVQLRAEAFNVFNRTNFRGISTAVWTESTRPVAYGGTCTTGCSTFGQVTSTRDPRILQFGAKISF